MKNGSFNPISLRMAGFRHTFTIFCCIALVLVAMGARALGWDFVEKNGVSYVTMSSLRSFYGFSLEKKEGSSHLYEMKTCLLKVRPASQDMYMNGVKFVLSYPIAEDPVKGLLISKMDVMKIVDPVLRPAYIGDKVANGVTKRRLETVVIDPGHGGHDSGAKNRVSLEKDLNLQVAKLLRAKLLRAGYKVVMTRETDRYLTLQERVQIANRYRNAVFVSIHFNDGGSSANGIETFTLAPAGTSSTMSRNVRRDPLAGNTQDSFNIALATAVQGNLIRGKESVTKGMRPFDRGIKRARYSVLCTIQHPAILVECGFLSNAREATLAQTDSYKDFLAESICSGVRQYKRALERSR